MLAFLLLLLSPPTPHVEIRTSVSYVTCADNPRQHREFTTEHKHVYVFARAVGPVEDGDRLLFDVSAREIELTAEREVATVSFPAGVGSHKIIVRWINANKQIKRESSTSISVYPYEYCQ